MPALARNLLTASSVYAAFLVDVTLRAGLTVWLPNMLLLVAFIVAKQRSGVFWATGAGLLCDGLIGRPLGVTMIVAALTTTLFRELPALRTKGGGVLLLRAFLFVLVIEFFARLLANTVMAHGGEHEPLTRALQVAVATVIYAATAKCMLWIFLQVSRAVFSSRPEPMPLSLSELR